MITEVCNCNFDWIDCSVYQRLRKGTQRCFFEDITLGWMSSSFISFAVVIYSGIKCREDDVEYARICFVCALLLMGEL